MKIKSTMYYDNEAIAECEWTLNDKASAAQRAMAAISVEDHLKELLSIEHKMLGDDDVEEEAEEKEVEEAKEKSESVTAESEETDDAGDPPKEQSCRCTYTYDQGYSI